MVRSLIPVRRSAALLTLAVLVIGVLAGCFMPLFDLETSLAYQTASKMTKMATIGPIGEFSRDRISSGADYYYLPSRNLPPGYGLFVEADDFGVSILYLAPDPTENNRIRRVGDPIEWLLDNEDPRNFDFVVFPIVDSATPSDAAYLVAYPSTAGATVDTYGYVVGSNLNPIDTGDAGAIVSGPVFPPAEALAFAVDIDTTPGFEPARFLIRDSSSTAVDTYLGALSDGVVPTALAAPGILPLPDAFTPTGGTAAFDSALDTTVYSNYDTAGFYNVYRWDSSFVPEKLPVRQRIDAILATGELYHRGANSDEVYDANGRRKYSIPTGKLHFAYEITVASVPTMFYTLVYFDEVGDNDDDNMYIDIYAIPTADLGDLE